MFLTLLLNRYVIGAGIGVLLLVSAYTKGHMDASADCHEAELLAKIATMNRDIAISKSAADDAAKRANQLEQSNSESNMKVAAYERELASRKGDSCSLGVDDLRRLRGIDGSR
jgi:hypothetical protein